MDDNNKDTKEDNNAEGTRVSHPWVIDFQHPQISKPHCGLKIMDTLMGFLCPFYNMTNGCINLTERRGNSGCSLPPVSCPE